LVQGVLPVLSLYVLKVLVDRIAAGLATSQPLAAFREIIFWLLLAAAAMLAADVCRSLASWAAKAHGELVQDYVSDLLHAKSVEVDLEYYENAQFYNALHRAQEQAAWRPMLILTAVVQAGQNGIALLAMTGLLLSLHWLMAILLVATAMPGLLVRLKYARELYVKQREWTKPERRAEYLHTLLIGPVAAKEIRLFNLGDFFRERFRELRRHIREEKLDLARKRSLAELSTQAGATLAVYAGLGFVAYRTLRGAVTLGGLVMYYQAFQRAQASLWALLVSLAELYEHSLFLNDLNQFLSLPRTVPEPELEGHKGGEELQDEETAAEGLPGHRTKRPQAQTRNAGLLFENVTFTYPRCAHAVLRDINLKIRPGETIALVGENGAGKTTLVKLLCRLYDPTHGRITLNGVDLRSIPVVELRKQISVLFQDFTRYNLTACENIALGNVDLLPRSGLSPHQPPASTRTQGGTNSLSTLDSQLFTAAQRADAHEVISRLPKGYETTLGRQFEEGEELSVGEWQKVALARAFLRPASVVVLDEPTSALDPIAEHMVLKRFCELLEGRLGIIISHRLSTVTQVDRIFVLREGRIAESGCHQELVQRGGLYARLFETQAERYR